MSLGWAGELQWLLVARDKIAGPGKKVVCATQMSDDRWKREAAGGDAIYDDGGWVNVDNRRGTRELSDVEKRECSI